MQLPNKPVVLAILDGWGIAPPSRNNPIPQAKKPNLDFLIDNYPAMTIQASSEAVGLPWGEMGNSEVGHLNLGSGWIIYQNLPRISRAISDGSFFTNEAFLGAVKHVKKNKSKLHLMGLASLGGVHSSLDHLSALINFCKQNKIEEVYIHAFLDGRDVPQDSAVNFIQKLLDKIKELKVGKIATLIGRYYAMDRDNRWDREEKAYLAMTEGKADRTGEDPINIIKKAYKEKNYDEEFIPTVITEKNQPVATIDDKDAVIFFNYRPDRARQISTAFVLPGFEKFNRPKLIKDLFFVSMTQYDKDLPTIVAFPPEKVNQPLGKVIADAGLKQLHIAETEKYAHVTYFFNGGNEKPFKGQDNALVPSPGVSSYDKKPEMSANEVTNRLLKEIKKNKYDFIVVNYANADMVGHTGNLKAVIKSIETIDDCIGRLYKAVLDFNGVMFITSDHGNAEILSNPQTGAIDKEHTVNPVPFIAIRKDWQGKTLYADLIQDHDLSMIQPTGILSDVPVTILTYMGIKPSPEMTGHNLLLQ